MFNHIISWYTIFTKVIQDSRDNIHPQGSGHTTSCEFSPSTNSALNRRFENPTRTEKDAYLPSPALLYGSSLRRRITLNGCSISATASVESRIEFPAYGISARSQPLTRFGTSHWLNDSSCLQLLGISDRQTGRIVCQNLRLCSLDLE